MPRVAKRKGLTSDKVKMVFDVPMLNAMIKYIRTDGLASDRLNYLYKFLNYLELESYQYQKDIYDRLRLLKTTVSIMVEDNIRDDDLLISTILSKDPEFKSVIDAVGFEKNRLSLSEQEKIHKAIIERLKTMAIFQKKDEIINILEKIDGSSYETSYYSLVKELQDKLSRLLVELQSADVNQGLLREFSFSSENFATLMEIIVKKSKLPTAILQTGIRQLNSILSPGFKSGRLYTIVGGSGKFKSGTLLNLADQIRRFNPQIVPYENGRRKCILFITLENSIEESIERLFDMYSGINDEMRDMSLEDIIGVLKGDGEFNFTGDSGIDIEFRYYGNLEISTDEIYSIIRDLNDKGKEPICLILDYIKRIDSAHNNGGDERTRMSFVGKELKNIAQYFEISVITAMQLNREGNNIIDSAMRESKEDVARFVGSSNIGNAWDIIEDSDWVGLINLELQKSTGKLFLTWKRLKIRGKKDMNSQIDYFNHPFTNEKNIRLETDVDKEKPLSIISLSTDLESIAERNSETGRRERPTLSSIYNNKDRVSNTLKSISIDSIVPKSSL